MKTSLKVTRPNEIEFTLTATMTLARWLELQEQLSQKWPSWELSAAITDMLSQANKVYLPKETAE